MNNAGGIASVMQGDNRFTGGNTCKYTIFWLYLSDFQAKKKVQWRVVYGSQSHTSTALVSEMLSLKSSVSKDFTIREVTIKSTK